MSKELLAQHIHEVLENLGVPGVDFVLEHPAEMSHGDFATNAAMVAAKKIGKKPHELAQIIVGELVKRSIADITDISIAGPGFINFKLADGYFTKALGDAIALDENYGKNETLKGKKVVVEYTDPNPFKEFHIGHLMSNTIGESISRIVEASGAETKRACYQGDTGMHAAAALWGMLQEDLPAPDASITIRAQFLGRAYARGATSAKNDMVVHDAIIVLNKKIHERSDPKINELYDLGKAWSLEYFETIYKRLGTAHGADGKAFDYYFFESVTGQFGKTLVCENMGKVFEDSNGAIIFKGEESMGLHTRVFVNKEGLPTYEAKELGLAKIKYDTYPYDVSIVVTANEINDYFKVLLEVLRRIFPELAAKTVHIAHGMLRLPSGKMSSRTGEVITAESLLDDVKVHVMKKVADMPVLPSEKDAIAESVAVGAIKYSILRQSSGKDIIFDFDQSLSFEGDSGPYLQYTHARTCSLLEKAHGRAIDPRGEHHGTRSLHKFILRFPEVVLRANKEHEPHYITTYLIELAREFNAFYANTIVLDGAPDEPYKLALVKAVSLTMKNGLQLLGMPTPSKM